MTKLNSMTIPRKQQFKSHPGKIPQDFVIPRSMKLLQMMDLPHDFLDVDPDVWHDRDDYKHARETLQSLRVVNDQAERGVALIQEFQVQFSSVNNLKNVSSF